MADSIDQSDEGTGRPRASRSLRSRLDELLTQPSPTETAAPDKPSAGLRPVIYQRELPRRSPMVRLPDPSVSGQPLRLEEAVPGSATSPPRGGTAYLVQTPVARMAGADGFSQTFAEAMRRPDWPLRSRLVDQGFPADGGPEEVVLLDLETAGLGSAPLFLIGALVWVDGGLHVVQYLARDYAEEAAAIDLFLAAHQDRRLLVTFNGKSFDFPFLRARAATTGIPFNWAPWHLDLLHASRRAWGRALPDCRLQTLERFICHRSRSGDIDGAQIPEAYHAFVRTGDATEMVEVIRHNLLDLLTLAELMTRFPAA